MKTIKLIAVLLILSGLVFAQSDLKTVNEFKSKLEKIEKEIERSDSAETLNSLSMQLDQLESEYKNEKELLDQSLYPENFKSSITKVRIAIREKRTDFVQKEVLEVKVDELKGELEKLNEKNSSLLSEIKEYQDIGGSPEEVRNLISQLRATLDKRDQLVKNMVDSLLSEFVNQPKSLSEAELQKVYEKIESDKLFYNVEKTVRDNIEFLKVTSLNPENLNEVKEDQIHFYRLWKKLGPKIAEAYSGSKDRSEDVSYINGLFSQWERQLDGEIWANVKAVFDNNSIKVESFNSGEAFIESVTSYIDSQMVKFEEVGYDQSHEKFTKFNEDIWQDELRSTWIPILRDNQMLSEQQYETLQSKMDGWEAMYNDQPTNLWYFAGLAILLALIILAYILGTKSKKQKENNENNQTA